jgi:hypothetical protein
MKINKEIKKIIWLPISLAIIIVILVAVLLFVSVNKSDVKNVTVKSGQEITSPLVVEGEAKGSWFFEGNMPIKILDEAGNILGTSYVMAKTDWMTEDYVAFKGEINFATPTGGKGFLVIAKDNPSGLAENDKEIKIPVVLTPIGYTKIKVYFNNDKMDPEISCNKVFAAEREILKIEAIGTAVVNELLNGPTQAEKDQGFFTNINSGVRLLSLNVDENGTAYADFDKQLETGIGGSCKVAAIRAQITETLKQFPTVKNVVISIDGRTEDILQP